MVRNSGAILASQRAAMLERLRTGDGGATLLNYDNHRSREGAGLAAGHGRDRSPGLFVDGPLVAGTDGAVHGLDYARQTLAECGGGAGLLVGSQCDRKLEDFGTPLWQLSAAPPVTATLWSDHPRQARGLPARAQSRQVRAAEKLKTFIALEMVVVVPLLSL